MLVSLCWLSLTAEQVLPFRLPAAIFVGLEVGLRAFLVAAVVSWVLLDVRQPSVVVISESVTVVEVDASKEE